VPSASDITSGQALAQGYSDLIKTRPVLNRAAKLLNASYDGSSLVGDVDVTTVRSIINIRATGSDPTFAAALANATAQAFIEETQDRQLSQIARFQAILTQNGSNVDPNNLAAQVAVTMSNLSILEPALVPGGPISASTKRNLILAVFLGIVAAGAVAFIKEHLDDRLKSPDELKAVTGMTTLGAVLRYKTSKGAKPIPMFLEERGHSAKVESYKFLRTNLEFSGWGVKGLNTVLVTSSSPGEGKTTTATNLAISLAQEGKSVVLVDLDLRRPALHKVFDLKEPKGLTNVLMGNAVLEEALSPTQLPGLRVLASGPIPPDPTLLIRSPKMAELLRSLKTAADFVVFDSPPLLAVTDPLLLASHVDAVLMVIDAEKTNRNTAHRGAEVLRQAKPEIRGVVLNKIAPKGAGSGYYYYYYYYYYDYAAKNGAGNGRRRFFGLLPGRHGTNGVRGKERTPAAVDAAEATKEAGSKRNGGQKG